MPPGRRCVLCCIELLGPSAAVEPHAIDGGQARFVASLVNRMVVPGHLQFIHKLSPWTACRILRPPVIHTRVGHQGRAGTVQEYMPGERGDPSSRVLARLDFKAIVQEDLTGRFE